MPIRVRELEEQDKTRWLELFRGYIAFYEASVPDETIEIVWQRMLTREPGSHIGLVAVDAEDRPVGLAHILLHRSTWSAGWYCYLEDLFVDPAVRGQGVGLALIEATYREADARGATRTYWVTQDHNATARSLYEKVAKKAPFVQYRR